MSKIKKHIHVPDIKLQYESEIAKNRTKTLYSGKDICGELYHVLDLNDEKKTKLEKISHYKMAQGLYDEIANIDAFFLGKSTFQFCNKGDFNNLRSIILISMFTSYKETYMAEKGYSRDNCFSQITNEDLAELNVSGRINIIRAPANKLSSDQRIISQIRNALDHTHYFPEGNMIHIREPQTGFEAKVPLDFLCDFIDLVQTKSRRELAYGIDAKDKRIYYPNDFKFDDVKDKVEYRISMKSNKEKSAYISARDDLMKFLKLHKNGMTEEEKQLGKNISRTNFDEYKKLSKLHENGSSEAGRDDKIMKFTDKLENLARTYFNENGESKNRIGHRIDYKNLKYLGFSMFYPCEEFLRGVLEFIGGKINANDCKFYSDDLIDQMGVFRAAAMSSGLAFRRGKSDVEISELLAFVGTLLDVKLKNGKSILSQPDACKVFALEYFLNQGFDNIVKIVKNPDGGQEHKLFLKHGNSPEISFSNIEELCGSLNSYYFMGRQSTKTFPSWLKIQYIESVYVNELVSLKRDDVPGLIGSGTKKSGDKFTNREHVRNALVHNNYVMLSGVNEIVLRDGYDIKTDTWAREESINLSKLYRETYKEMSGNMNKESDVELKILDTGDVK